MSQQELLRNTYLTMPQYEIVIEPKKSSGTFLKELRAYRELFYFLAWRDILVRYKQTVIGIA